MTRRTVSGGFEAGISGPSDVVRVMPPTSPPDSFDGPFGRTASRRSAFDTRRVRASRRDAPEPGVCPHGVEASVGQLISYVCHPYEHYTVELYLYECKLETESLRALAVNDFRWVKSAEFDNFEFTPADEASMAQLLGVIT